MGVLFYCLFLNVFVFVSVLFGLDFYLAHNISSFLCNTTYSECNNNCTVSQNNFDSIDRKWLHVLLCKQNVVNNIRLNIAIKLTCGNARWHFVSVSVSIVFLPPQCTIKSFLYPSRKNELMQSWAKIITSCRIVCAILLNAIRCGNSLLCLICNKQCQNKLAKRKLSDLVTGKTYVPVELLKIMA